MALAVGSLLAPLSVWLYSVNQTVTEPYLDEVFHVRQAQHYCNERFDIWDPKITTPPGLYLLSYLASKVPFVGCSISSLRALNAVGLIALALVLYRTYSRRTPAAVANNAGLFAHAAVNLVLFPPLFFFSGLYYTDIWSTFFVALFYLLLLDLNDDRRSRALTSTQLVVVGIVSLLFRQTNVFWVAIFPAGLVLVQQLDRGHDAVKQSMSQGAEGFGNSWFAIARTSWKMEAIYDPPIRSCWADGKSDHLYVMPRMLTSWTDFAKTSISIAACAMKLPTQPKRLGVVVAALAPFGLIAGIFTAFVLWNGSVVLGDKSNHVATLHFPQMLYFWPFIAFFSWPILYPYLLLTPISILARLPLAYGSLEAVQMFRRGSLLPRLGIALIAVLIAGAAVYGNTIVHPFTLADNRHYVFYIFRLLLNPWWVRYAVTPVYVVCAWSSIQALGAGKINRSGSGESHRLPIPDGQHSARVSFAIVWLLTSTLQLVTAPLVEPRYFILPWLMWRLHVPLAAASETKSQEHSRSAASWSTLWEQYDHRLWLESAWMLAINAATGYVFLYWTFGWLQEPGKLQRFMW